MILSFKDDKIKLDKSNNKCQQIFGISFVFYFKKKN